MKRSTYRMFGLLLVTIMAVAPVLVGCKKENTAKDPEPTPVAETTKEDNITPEAETEGETGKETGTEEAGDDKEDGFPEVKAHYGTVKVEEVSIYTEDFEDGQTDFTGRGAAKVQVVSDKAKDGSNSMFVSGRTALWNGATINLSKDLQVGQRYMVKAEVYYENGPDTIQFDCKVEKNSKEYLSFGSAKGKKGEWVTLSGNITIPKGTNSASVYFETGFAGGELIDFYVDSITITQETATVDRGEIPSLKDIYKDLYSIGVAATPIELTEERQELVKQQFNSVTPGNELKPDSLLDYNTCISDPKYDDNPQVNFTRAEFTLDFAKEAGIPMRGHTLVWHSQTPRWFFAVGYSSDENAPLVSKELMLKRLENYIKNVLEYVQTNYPGMIYAWDVVNEAIETGDGEPGGYRSKDSLWYQVIGPEFVEKAFEYARKYADKDVKLFYNDYSTEDSRKMLAIYELAKGLKEKGLIDGLGLQCHFTMENPSLVKAETSIRKYAELGLEIHITELDMGLNNNTEEDYLRQAKRYKRFFTLLKRLKETGAANITNITFWGLSDDISWLNKPSQPSYPLLFDKYLIQKPAFWAVALSPDIPSN